MDVKSVMRACLSPPVVALIAVILSADLRLFVSGAGGE